MKHFSRIFLIVILILSVAFISCGDSHKSKNAITEGIIEYDAKVLNESHLLAPFAPSKATVKLKNEKWLLEMSSFGIFDISFICNLNDHTLTQMVKYMDFQNACTDDTIALLPENDEYKLTFQETNDTKMIAGYKCKRLIAKKVSNPAVVFDVYYAPDIATEECNQLTPYKGIKGMLMDYRMVRIGLELHFKATSVKKATIEDKDFEIPENFTLLTRPEFNEKFTHLLNNLL